MEAAAAVKVEAFVPRKGVQIETDPKAAGSAPVMHGDDASAIDGLAVQLQVRLVGWVGRRTVQAMKPGAAAITGSSAMPPLAPALLFPPFREYLSAALTRT